VPDDEARRAAVRRAHARLGRLEQRRDLGDLLSHGTARADVVRILRIDAVTYGRLSLANESHPPEADETAEELILRALAEGTDRRLLVEVLGGLDYDGDPATHRWDDVADGVRDDSLTQEEYDAVRSMHSAIRRSAREGWRHPITTAAIMREALAESDDAWLLRTALEARSHLHRTLREAPDLVPAWQAAPAPVDDRWDALLAALVGHEFALDGRPEPSWTTSRVLSKDWVVQGGDATDDDIRRQTPDWLASRHILIRERDLG
jgi:hypothetical protein